jgi:hypothetical protein
VLSGCSATMPGLIAVPLSRIFEQRAHFQELLVLYKVIFHFIQLSCLI